jgi:hypothetical protein
MKKMQRGDATLNRVRTTDEFYKRDKNDVYDYAMEKYVHKLKDKFNT